MNPFNLAEFPPLRKYLSLNILSVCTTSVSEFMFCMCFWSSPGVPMPLCPTSLEGLVTWTAPARAGSAHSSVSAELKFRRSLWDSGKEKQKERKTFWGEDISYRISPVSQSLDQQHQDLTSLGPLWELFLILCWLSSGQPCLITWFLFEVDPQGKSLYSKSRIWCSTLISKPIFRCVFWIL